MLSRAAKTNLPEATMSAPAAPDAPEQSADINDDEHDPEFVEEGSELAEAEPSTPSLFNTLSQPQNRQVGRSLAISMLMMAIFPIAAFYISHWYVLPRYLPDVNQRLTYSGIIAVIVIKIVSTAYAFFAWAEEKQDKLAEDAENARLEQEATRRMESKKDE